MNLVVYVEPSSGTYPGHMIVGQEPDEGDPGEVRYFGFRFDPADLPQGYQTPEQWRDYLFNNQVPGTIVDETAFVNQVMADRERTFYEKRAPCPSGTRIEDYLPPPEQRESHGWYSFNPDDAPPERQPCYNDVKWAITIANRMVAGFFVHVRQGRVELIWDQLQIRPS